MSVIQAIDFTVKTDDLSVTQFREKDYSTQLLPNQVLLAIDKFAFTSNNITYGVVGEKMNYWQFFPTTAGHGILPAWGFADVVQSNHPDVPVGQRFYGYYPMSSHLLVTVGHVSSKGFVDGSEHRQSLPPIYNFYTDTDQDPGYHPKAEALICLFRPLFITSFLIDSHLAAEDFYGAGRIIITSASSKTAQALAFLLAQRIKNIQLTGFTSPGNAAFVQASGCYDQVLTYEQIGELDNGQKHAMVDFAGNHSTQFRLQTQLKENLLYHCRVGLVDWQNLEEEKDFPYPSEFFFAPDYAIKFQKAWGRDKFQQKAGQAWLQFIRSVQSNITINECNGTEQLQQLHLDMLHGKINPQQGNIVSLNKPG